MRYESQLTKTAIDEDDARLAALFARENDAPLAPPVMGAEPPSSWWSRVISFGRGAAATERARVQRRGIKLISIGGE